MIFDRTAVAVRLVSVPVALGLHTAGLGTGREDAAGVTELIARGEKDGTFGTNGGDSGDGDRVAGGDAGAWEDGDGGGLGLFGLGGGPWRWSRII